ncbi:hypothetical protein GPJ56_003010 [Histomonas meleagridis]|uniref:uncharacterized protein n=1 Tax=Histomonas meleagridis TaxID=135588 RepID=UPI00355A7C3A|nr:hypothetical protein GPJ56_003010 [Histomonas meleagridis]KAH0796666.1 hypothetical protein GO595_010559 [Histomonas meleagridis]
MSYLLHEVLLGALGIKGDLEFFSSSDSISAIDLELLPPSAGPLISRVNELGNTYRMIEETIEQQQQNPYNQALYDSIDNYLDQYRTVILSAEQDITNGKLTTLTGLIARIEPYQHELQFIGRIIPPILNSTPLEMMNKLHEYSITSPPSLSSKISLFLSALHQVAITQLNCFLFYHQKIPDIFEETSDGSITFTKSLNATFLPKQLSDLLLLIVYSSSRCTDLFSKSTPPSYTKLEQWIISMSRTTSHLLSLMLSDKWPSFYQSLSSLYLIGRSDYVSIIARKSVQPFASSYDLNCLLPKFERPFNVSFDLTKKGVILKSDLTPPIDMVVTNNHQIILSEMFRIFVRFSASEECLNDLWCETKKLPKVFGFIGLVYKLISALKEHIVFGVICPSLKTLQKSNENLTDFFKFKAMFSVFMKQISENLPITNNEFQNLMDELCDKVIYLHQLFVEKSLLQKMNSKQMFEVIAEVGNGIILCATKIGEIMNKNDEIGINLINRITKFTNCIQMYCK